MAEGLFDNRYRYNYIYPRGRSGETLQAVDSQAGDRPVVIKRPNPNDAPPIRAGQEVSIVNEREALTRLAGHPVLTELLGSGQFFVGGMPHQYIVMERARGVIIADEVARLAGQHQRLPLLELVEIIGRLVNLLRTAHDNDIVYNDVDAKHLFWNRETYELKVIDWGNAVFLEGDEVTMQGISRQTDIYQLGELMYFILSGGYRVEVPRGGGAEFQVDFHQDSETIDRRLQAIVTRAVHPNLRYRYASMSEVNADLLRFRGPLEQERNAIISRAMDKLRRPDLSHNDLLSLQGSLQGALRHNPAYPAARKTSQEIVDRLRDLEVSADLDAVKIYMRGGHYASAAELLSGMRERAGSKTAGLVRLLLDWARLLADSQPEEIPPACKQAADCLFDYHSKKAARLLLDAGADAPHYELAWQLAERVSAHFPTVILLQPNLLRAQLALTQRSGADEGIDDARDSLTRISQNLAETAKLAQPGAAKLRERYSGLADSLAALDDSLSALDARGDYAEGGLPVNALGRALQAARSLSENMQVISQQAASDPREALTALDASRAIDPANPVWDKLEDFLGLLYEILQDSQNYVPAADGSDLESWLKAKQEELLPFAAQLSDQKLNDMIDGLGQAQAGWQRYRDVIVSGDRAQATAALDAASVALRLLSPALAAWFRQLRSVVENAKYIERHSVPGHLGRTLADGWAAFDQGSLADAERLGQQALEIARSESEQHIAKRLWRLSRVMRDWVERNGVASHERTAKALMDIEALFSDSENRAINGFAAQMPSTETYLKAMGQGLAQSFESGNTAALRLLFAHYILSGALDAHEAAIDDARFWQEAALRALPKLAQRHSAQRKLDEYIAKRESLLSAQALFNQVNGAHIVDSLGELARQLDGNPEARLLAPGIQSLRALESALQDWADAEFRTAGGKIDDVLRGITEVESNTGLSLDAYRKWMGELNTALAELSVKRRSLLQEIDRQLDEPLPGIREAIHRQADVTEDLLSFTHAQLMLGWRDTYEAILNIYQGQKPRSQKLAAMDEQFKAMFIDRNPAYPLFRHWYRVVEALPDEPEELSPLEPAEPEPAPAEHAVASDEAAADADEAPEQESAPGQRRWLFRLALSVGLLLIIGGLMVLARSGDLEALVASIAPQSAATSQAEKADDKLDEAAADEPAEPMPAAQASDAPQLDKAAVKSAATDPPASATPTPTDAPTATSQPTDTPTPKPTRVLPPEGLTGAQNLLSLFSARLETPFWDEDSLKRQDEAWRLGTGEASAGDTLVLTVPAELLEGSYGNRAPRRVSSLQAELTLHSANPALGSDDSIYFGLALQSPDGSTSAGIQIEQVDSNIISLAHYSDGQAAVIRELAVSNLIARLRLEFDRGAGTVRVYFNDGQVGDALAFAPDDGEALPAIFVKDGGLVIGISAWSVTLD